MKFDDKTKKIVCICLAAAMIVPLGISLVYMFLGA